MNTVLHPQIKIAKIPSHPVTKIPAPTKIFLKIPESILSNFRQPSIKKPPGITPGVQGEVVKPTQGEANGQPVAHLPKSSVH
jgi:hypothetical protein